MSRLLALLPLIVAASLGLLLLIPAEGAPAPKKRNDLTNSIGMKFKRIPAGKFMMGADDSDKGASPSEKPRHEIEISKPFYLGIYEVTQEEYEKVMSKNPSFWATGGKGAAKVAGVKTNRFPVDSASWDDAQDFCRKLGERNDEKRANRSYRLPTEAEWEYACRGGQKDYQLFGLGASLDATKANISSKLGRPTTVGSYKPNAWGLHDMHGNVWEWCSDWKNDTYYKSSPKKDPKGADTGTYKILRGGTWASGPGDCRSAYRAMNSRGERNEYCGFRVVCEVK